MIIDLNEGQISYSIHVDPEDLTYLAFVCHAVDDAAEQIAAEEKKRPLHRHFQSGYMVSGGCTGPTVD